MDAAEEWLEQNTIYCSRLRARITPEQCQINHKRANQDGQFWAEKMPGVSLKKCRGCPGVNGEAREEEMPKNEPGPNERRCNVCGRIKELEKYYRPIKGQENQIDPRRVKTCIKCERRHGWCPQDYMALDIQEPINYPSTTEDPAEEDPLASAQHIEGAPIKRNYYSNPVARTDPKCRYFYLSKQACRDYPVTQEYPYLDFYLAADGTPLLLFHASPAPSSRKIQSDNKLKYGGLKVSCRLFQDELGWKGRDRFLVQGTSRYDVLRLVRVEQ
jgi:hypothetical protein